MHRSHSTTTTKTGRNGSIYQKEGESKYIRIGKITSWTLQEKRESIQTSINGQVENYEGNQDWEVDVNGIFINNATKINEVYLKLYSFEGIKVTHEGFGFLQGFSLTNEPDKFSGKIMGNGPIKSYES